MMSRAFVPALVVSSVASLILGVATATADVRIAPGQEGVADSNRTAAAAPVHTGSEREPESWNLPGIGLPPTPPRESGPFVWREDVLPVAGPSDGAWLGANVARRDTKNGFTEVGRLEDRLNRPIEVVNRFHEFSAGLTSNFHFDQLHIDEGRTLMVSWRATDNPGSTKGQPDPDRAKKISSGQYDREIKAMARKLRALDAPVLLRFNWEMDQPLGQNQYVGSPAEFIAAWRHVHDLFAAENAHNVAFVWAPRAASFNKGAGQKFYPGDAYVDWIGGSAVPIDSFRTPKKIFGAWYDWSSARDKPLLLWVGLRENPQNPSWKPGFINSLTRLASDRWEDLSAVVYYHAQSPKGHRYWSDTTSASWTAFRGLACSPTFTKSSGVRC